MSWTLTFDADEFAASALADLAREPVHNTLLLTITDALRCGHRYSEQAAVFGWYDDGVGRISGAFVMTPPHDMVLSRLSEEAIGALADALRHAGTQLPGVNADERTAEAFARAWTAGTTAHSAVQRRQRLYRLERLVSPARPVPGRPRLATLDDQVLLADWLGDFFAEAHLPESVSSMSLTGRIADGRVTMWQDEAGSPVSFAGRQKTIGSVARIGPVYTPPEHRRRGYGAAVTAACTSTALEGGAAEAILFTDLANPTSNSIYRQIGYTPVADSVVVRFEGG